MGRGAGYLVLALGLVAGCERAQPTVAALPLAPAVEEASAEQVHRFCGSCHAYPPPDTFPRAAWRKEVVQAYEFHEQSSYVHHAGRPPKAPPLESVVAYYEKRAPEQLPLLTAEPAAGPDPFHRVACQLPAQPRSPAVSCLTLAHLSRPDKLDLLACDMRSGAVVAARPYETVPSWRLLGRCAHPAHVEAVDLDGDGRQDLLVADLGSFPPTDELTGKVVWLQATAAGEFTPRVLLGGVGRVADVQAADFNGDGRLDLVVAVFGWRNTGSILFLENRTTDWSRPEFVPHVVDSRHGAIHVPAGDLNGDGRPDFAALISQEHETVVAFLNEGGGRFRPETVYAAPHPAFGCTGIQLVDLDADGRLDVLLSNGDVLDPPYLLKPYHGIHWLRNRGKFPFVHQPLAAMYGVHRAVAADVTGDGQLDVVAVGFLPAEELPQRAALRLDAVILLEQTAPGKFTRHSLESATCDHATCVAGDWDGDGRVHLAVGNFCLTEKHTLESAVTLWNNQGARRVSR